MNAALKGVIHYFVSATAVAAADTLMSGAPLTSNHVLVPSAVAGVLAVVHAAFPSILSEKENGPRAPSVPRFPSSR